MTGLLPLRRHLPAIAALLLLALLSYYRLVLQDRILVGYDTLTYFYPNEQYAADALRAGRLPLWNPHLFTGVPFLANPQTAVFYPLNLLFVFLPVPQAYAYSIALHVFLAAVFAYAFAARTLRLQPLAALVVAMAYAFGGFLGALSGHLNQLQASAWLPILFLFGEDAYRRCALRPALLGSMAIAAQFLAGHMQVFYISMAGLALFLAWRIGGDLRATKSEANAGAGDGWIPVFAGMTGPRGIFRGMTGPRGVFGGMTGSKGIFRGIPQLGGIIVVGLMLALGLALTAAQLLPTYELTKESIRAGGMSYEDATSFSLPPWLLLRALLPAFGDPRLFSEWIGYVGVVTLVLAVFAIVWSPRHRDVAFFAGLAALALFLALGQFNPIYPLIHRVVPGLNLFRVPARWLLLYSFAAASLAGIGTQVLLQSGIERAQKGAAHFCGGAPGERRSPLRFVGVPPQLCATPAQNPRYWRSVIITGIALCAMATLLLMLALKLDPTPTRELPGSGTTALWLLALFAGLGTLGIGGLRKLRNRDRQDDGAARTDGSLVARKKGSHYVGVLLCVLIAGELLLAGQGQESSRVNLPEAVSALRPSIAHILAQPGLFRVLPFSEGAFDPGDLKELKEMAGRALSTEEAYDYVVATKHKETLTPNLPLLFGISSIDGYDGGVLPLKRYVDLKRLFSLATPNTADGRLREQLTTVPDQRLLNWLNVRYVLMDRVRDAWVDGVYYDLGLTRLIRPEAPLALPNIPALDATSIGIISHLRGAGALPDGAPVAEVVVTTVSGVTYRTTLRAGADTAEGRWSAGTNSKAAHAEARRAKSWRGEPEAWDYVTTVRLPAPDFIREIRLLRQGGAGEFALRGVSVIDERRQLSFPVVIDPDLRLSHLGDVKIYESGRALERTFLVHDVATVPGDEAALAAMQQPGFDPTRQVLVMSEEWAKVAAGWPGGSASVGDRVTVVEYAPERVRIATESAQAGVLVLTDSYYPGWRATIDGHPAPLLRADYLFRAVVLPAGKHEVVFLYDPELPRLGIAISIAALAMLSLGIAAGLRKGNKSGP